MVGTSFKPSFDMFTGLTKEDLLNAPSVPLEKLQDDCKELELFLQKKHEMYLKNMNVTD